MIMKLRNIAIIAHVDHGKTTLVDNLLKQSGSFRKNQRISERVMDSNDLEKERGITILAKVTSVQWNDARINIVDTPGHADFGGEVERILSMVDGVILLVDAAEGPMPQTKFVLAKALKIGLKPIVLINKVDRPDSRIDEVVDSVFDLFVALDATNEQLDFPILYGSGRNGWVSKEQIRKDNDDMKPLFDMVMDHVAEPKTIDGPFTLLGTMLEVDPFLGPLITGRIHSGTVKINQNIKVLNCLGELIEVARVSKILAFRGIERETIDTAHSGDIVALAGFVKGSVSDTFCDSAVEEPLQALPIDPPTVTMSFLVNDSPFAGTEGDKVTTRMLQERLLKEAEGNITLKIEISEEKDAYMVSGRGELQLAILIETMRREGYEFAVSRPRVVYKTDDQGQRLEPIEEVIIDVDDAFSGTVVQSLAERRGDLHEMKASGSGRTRLIFHAPTRGLIGYQSELMTQTRGTATLNRLFKAYEPFKGQIAERRNGVLISNEQGVSSAYALWNLEDRGMMIVEPGCKVYRGMIVGEHNRENDLEVNVIKGKKLTNIRTTSKDEAVRLTPVMQMSLERALSWIKVDELVEVTPQTIRLRKQILDPNLRKRSEKAA